MDDLVIGDPVKAFDHGVVWWPLVTEDLDEDGVVWRLWARPEDSTLHAIMLIHPGKENHLWWSWEDVAEALGMEGDVWRLWVEEGMSDYVHIITMWSGPIGAKPEHFMLVGPGGTPDARTATLQIGHPLRTVCESVLR